MKKNKLMLILYILTTMAFTPLTLANSPAILNLKLGDNSDRMQKILGKPQMVKKDINNNDIYYYESMNLSVLVNADEGIHQFIIEGTSINVSGIKVGSSKKEIVEKLKNIKFIQHFDIESGTYKSGEGWNLVLFINSENETLSRMVLVVDRSEWPGNIKPNQEKNN